MDIYKKLSSLEYNAAATYLRLKDKKTVLGNQKIETGGSYGVLDYMIRESYKNAKKVESSGWDYKFPVVNEYRIEDLEKQIQDTLKKIQDIVDNSTDNDDVVKNLAGTERALAEMYQITSEYFEELSLHFEMLSREFSMLSKEEIKHAKILDETIGVNQSL